MGLGTNETRNTRHKGIYVLSNILACFVFPCFVAVYPYSHAAYNETRCHVSLGISCFVMFCYVFVVKYAQSFRFEYMLGMA